MGEKDAEGINELWRVSCNFFDSHVVELLLSGEDAIIMTTFSWANKELSPTLILFLSCNKFHTKVLDLLFLVGI